MLRMRSLAVLALLMVFTAAAALRLHSSSRKPNIDGALKSLSPSAMAAVHPPGSVTYEGRPLAFEPQCPECRLRWRRTADAVGVDAFRRAPVTSDIVLTSLEHGGKRTHEMGAHI